MTEEIPKFEKKELSREYQIKHGNEKDNYKIYTFVVRRLDSDSWFKLQSKISKFGKGQETQAAGESAWPLIEKCFVKSTEDVTTTLPFDIVKNDIKVATYVLEKICEVNELSAEKKLESNSQSVTEEPKTPKSPESSETSS